MSLILRRDLGCGSTAGSTQLRLLIHTRHLDLRRKDNHFSRESRLLLYYAIQVKIQKSTKEGRTHICTWSFFSVTIYSIVCDRGQAAKHLRFSGADHKTLIRSVYTEQPGQQNTLAPLS